MSREGDRELEAAFRALRRETGAGAPGFGDTLARLPGRRERVGRARRRAAIFAVAAAFAGVVLAVMARSLGEGRRPRVSDLAATRWETPTDFLLRTPGAELLRTLPTFTINERMLP